MLKCALFFTYQRRNEPEVEIVDGPYSLNISDGQSVIIYRLVSGLTYTFKVILYISILIYVLHHHCYNLSYNRFVLEPV